jgi:hypothetical protein
VDQEKRAGLLWSFLKDQFDWMRHNESQRSTLTTIFIAAYGVLVAFLPKDRPLYNQDWASPALMIVLGLVGIVAVFKYWERFSFHIAMSEAFRRELDKCLPGLDKVWVDGINTHLSDNRIWLKDPKYMQHWLWALLHLGAIVIGAALLIIALLGGHKP